MNSTHISPELQLILKTALLKRLDKTAKDDKKAGIKLAPGKQTLCGQVTLDLDMEIAKSEDGERAPTTSLPLKAILAIALQKAGIQRENIANLIQQAATEALEAGDSITDSLEMEATEEALQMVADTLKTLPKVPCAGQTRVTGRMDIVEFRPSQHLRVSA